MLQSRLLVRRWSVAVISLILLVACSAGPTSPSPSPSVSPATTATAAPTPIGPPASADDWPFFRGDAARTGKGGTGPIGQAVLRWQYKASGGVNSGVVVIGDSVYASSDDNILHALDIATGAERWRFNPVNPLVSAPSVAGDTVYAFDGVGTLFALDAATGHIRWHSAAALEGPSGPIVWGGVMYVGTADGAIVAVGLTDGAELWRYEVPSAGSIHNPAFADGIVYAATDKAGVVAIDAATHAKVWQFDTGTDITGSVVVADGIAYVGGTGESITGNLSAIDARMGTLRWQLNVPFTAPAVADGVAYISDQVGGLQARDTATGTELWGRPTERAQLSVAQGIVYMPVNAGKRVDAFDAATGASLWQFPVDGGNSCCVALAHGMLFTATEAGSIYAIGGDGTPVVPGSTPPPLASPLASGSPLATGSPTGVGEPAQLVWSSPGGDGGLDFPGALALDPLGRLWVADTGNSRFAILNPDGTFVEYWEHRGSGPGEFLLERSNGDGYGALVFAPDGSFYVLDVGNRRVERFDADRKLIKAWGGFGDAPGMYRDPISIAVDAAGKVYVLDDVRNVVESYNQDGSVLGSFPVHPATVPGFNSANSLALDANGNYYVSECCHAGNFVQTFDANGTPLLAIGPTGVGPQKFTEQPGSMSIDSVGRLFVAVGKVVDIFAADGSVLGSFAAPGVAQRDGWVSGLTLDGTGYGFLAEAGSNLVEKFQLLPPFGS